MRVITSFNFCLLFPCNPVLEKALQLHSDFQFLSIVSNSPSQGSRVLQQTTFNFCLLFPQSMVRQAYVERPITFQFLSIVSSTNRAKRSNNTIPSLSIFVYCFYFPLPNPIVVSSVPIFQFLSIVSLIEEMRARFGELGTFNFCLLFPLMYRYKSRPSRSLSIFVYCFNPYTTYNDPKRVFLLSIFVYCFGSTATVSRASQATQLSIFVYCFIGYTSTI